MVPNQENVEGDQPVQSHSHAQQQLQAQTCVQEHYILVKQDSSPFWNISIVLLFKALNNLSKCEYTWEETMQLVSGKIEFNACQVSLLWHNSLV